MNNSYKTINSKLSACSFLQSYLSRKLWRVMLAGSNYRLRIEYQEGLK